MNYAQRLALVLTSVMVYAVPVHAVIIYSNNFETNTAGFDTSDRSALPIDNQGFSSPNQSQFLGLFSTPGGGVVDSTSLTLTGLTSGAQYSVSIDLFIGKSWDGNSTAFGPNTWSLIVGGGTPATLVDTNFINLFPSDGILNNFTQSYSDSNPIGPGSNPPFTGADIAKTTPLSGSLPFYERYGIYYFGHGVGNPALNFTAGGATATLTFTGSLDQGVGDEFWALDNVVVESVVPEPNAFVLTLLGIGVLSGHRWKTRRWL